MPRRFTRNDSWDFGGKPAPTETKSAERRSRKRRLATSLVFTTLFFAGASLAAVAGNRLANIPESNPSAAASDTTQADPAAAPDGAAAPAAADPSAASPDGAAASDASAPAAAPSAAADPSAADAGVTDSTAASDAVSANRSTTATQPASIASASAVIAGASKALRRQTTAQKARQRRAQLRKVLLPKVKPAPAPEIEGPSNAATIWLNTPLPDPTPPALRLAPKFAANLKAAAAANGVNWAVMLGILRARGASGHSPADRLTLGRLAARLGSFGPTKGDWASIVAYSGDTSFADKASALARYDRAVGLNGLVNGLESAKEALAARLLSDPMVSIYEGGRNDIIQNNVDVRVLALIAYLRESFGQVTVSSLISGHRLYARPGVISAHVFGRAVDIAGLGNTPIQGHQEPGGITERAVRDILLLPTEVMPRQVISLLGLGGPSFPLADHYNHIHIGF